MLLVPKFKSNSQNECMLPDIALLLCFFKCLGDHHDKTVRPWYGEGYESEDTICMQQLYVTVKVGGHHKEASRQGASDKRTERRHLLGPKEHAEPLLPSLSDQSLPIQHFSRLQNETMASGSADHQRVDFKRFPGSADERTLRSSRHEGMSRPTFRRKQDEAVSSLGAKGNEDKSLLSFLRMLGKRVLRFGGEVELQNSEAQQNETALASGARTRSVFLSYILREKEAISDSSLTPVTVSIAIACALLLYFAAERVISSSSEKTRYSFQVLLCFTELVVVFTAYGLLQEYIMTRDYEGERFPSVMFLILVNRLVAIIVVLPAIAIEHKTFCRRPDAWFSTALPALTVLLSSWCQNSALLYITFPAQVVFKSSKIVPTMLLSTIVNREKHSWSEYGVAAVVTLSVAGFLQCTEQENESSPEHNTMLGIAMMVTFLISDSLTSTTEKRINVQFPDLSNTQMMLAMSCMTLLFGTFAMCLADGFHPALQFLQLHPKAVLHVFAFGLASTAGQYVVLHTIRTLGPVTYAIMMTLRQIISIVISAVLYNHCLTWQAYACAGIAFLATLSKPLAKWAGANFRGK